MILEPSPLTLLEVTFGCFGRDLGTHLLARGAIHPIHDQSKRKACYIPGVQNGFFDYDTTDFLALGLQAGRLSGITVWDFDVKEVGLSVPDPNVITRRGFHIYTPHEGEGNRYAAVPGLDIIANGNVVFYDPQEKRFMHPNLTDPDEMKRILDDLKRHEPFE